MMPLGLQNGVPRAAIDRQEKLNQQVESFRQQQQQYLETQHMMPPATSPLPHIFPPPMPGVNINVVHTASHNLPVNMNALMQLQRSDFAPVGPDAADDAEKPKPRPKPRPTLRRDVPVLPARYTRHCGGECGPGQVTVYDVHRQAVGAAAHKVEAVRAAHVDPCAATVGGLFAGLVPAAEKRDPGTDEKPDEPIPNDDDDEGAQAAGEEKPEPETHVVATVYHRPGRGFPLLPQRRVVGPTAEAAAAMATGAAPQPEARGATAVAVYGRLTDAELEEPTGATYGDGPAGAHRNPFTGELRNDAGPFGRGGFMGGGGTFGGGLGGMGGLGSGLGGGGFLGNTANANQFVINDDFNSDMPARARGRGGRGRGRGRGGPPQPSDFDDLFGGMQERILS